MRALTILLGLLSYNIFADTMPREEVDKMIRLHKDFLEGKEGGVRADFTLKDLRGLDLRGVDLRDANLFYVNLTDANLFYADLDDANLRNAELGGANLIGADLRAAILRGANLKGAKLIGADLYGADLRGADLYGADLRGADLRGANLSETGIISMKLSRAFLFYQPETGYLKIGCKGMHIEEWQRRYEAIGREHKYSDSDIEIYGLAIEILAKIVVK